MGVKAEIELMIGPHIRSLKGVREPGISRRALLRQLSAFSLIPSPAWARALASTGWQPPQHRPVLPPTRPAAPPLPTPLSEQDDQFLNGLEHANFLFFWEQGNPQTGLIKDRCNVRAKDTTLGASIASTGFGLTAICIGEKRGFISHEEARLRVLKALSFLWHKLPTHRGFFFHFANINTGERMWDSEVSSVDTAILLCGVLTCRQHFARQRHRRAGACHLRSRGLELAL